MPSDFWIFMTKILLQKSLSIRQFFTPSEIIELEKVLLKTENFIIMTKDNFQMMWKH